MYHNRNDCSNEVLLDELKSQGVTDITHIKLKPRLTERRPNANKNFPSNLYILSFERNKLPDHVTVGWTRLPVREYIPRPRRCFKCQRWGHSAKSCRSNDNICVNCGEQGHEAPCLKGPHCSNCQDSHKASSQSCFYYKLEEKALTIQVKQKLTYWESKSMATDILTKPSYAHPTRSSPAPSCEVNRSKPTMSTSQSTQTEQPTILGRPATQPVSSSPEEKAATKVNEPSSSSINSTAASLGEKNHVITSTPNKNDNQILPTFTQKSCENNTGIKLKNQTTVSTTQDKENSILNRDKKPIAGDNIRPTTTQSQLNKKDQIKIKRLRKTSHSQDNRVNAKKQELDSSAVPTSGSARNKPEGYRSASANRTTDQHVSRIQTLSQNTFFNPQIPPPPPPYPPPHCSSGNDTYWNLKNYPPDGPSGELRK